MAGLAVPQWVKKHLVDFKNAGDIPEEFSERVKDKFKKFHTDNPLVSIMIPAWNEEKNIARTLSSFADLKTEYPVEIVVMNNNSTDSTQEILDRCGVKSVLVKEQGIKYARQAGLDIAKGKYHLCADADSIYPPGWVDIYVKTLEDETVSCAYGLLAYIPPEGNGRLFFSVYEFLKKPVMILRKKNRVHLNVLGMNFGFRTEDGRKTGGFDYVKTRWTDGWMALKLRDYGKVVMLKSKDALNWTSSRRLLDDGTFGKALKKRIFNEIKRIPGYIGKKKQTRDS